MVVIGNLNLALCVDGQYLFSAMYEIAFILIVWALPLYFAERIEKHDNTFVCVVNNFYPEQLSSVNRESWETVIGTMGNVKNEGSGQNNTCDDDEDGNTSITSLHITSHETNVFFTSGVIYFFHLWQEIEVMSLKTPRRSFFVNNYLSTFQ